MPVTLDQLQENILENISLYLASDNRSYAYTTQTCKRMYSIFRNNRKNEIDVLQRQLLNKLIKREDPAKRNELGLLTGMISLILDLSVPYNKNFSKIAWYSKFYNKLSQKLANTFTRQNIQDMILHLLLFCYVYTDLTSSTLFNETKIINDPRLENEIIKNSFAVSCHPEDDKPGELQLCQLFFEYFSSMTPYILYKALILTAKLEIVVASLIQLLLLGKNFGNFFLPSTKAILSDLPKQQALQIHQLADSPNTPKTRTSDLFSATGDIEVTEYYNDLKKYAEKLLKKFEKTSDQDKKLLEKSYTALLTNNKEFTIWRQSVKKSLAPPDVSVTVNDGKSEISSKM